jgi:hypothetical protein
MQPVHSKHPHCLNCEYIFADADNYCPNCGQKNHEIKIPLSHLLHEFVEGIFHFDSKSLHSITNLLFRPGQLSKEFIDGKRVKYVPPIRFYIFISFIFFLLISVTAGNFFKSSSSKKGTATGISIAFFSTDSKISDAEKAQFSPAQLDSLEDVRLKLSSRELVGLDDTAIAKAMQERRIPQTKTNLYLAHQLAKIGNNENGEFAHLVVKSISYAMFILMPLYALILYLFYRKRTGYFIETMIISIHVHCFIFLLFAIIIVITRAFGTPYFFLLGLLLSLFYTYKAYRHIFAQHWFLTAVKTTAIALIYGFVTLFGMLVTMMLSVMIF